MTNIFTNRKSGFIRRSGSMRRESLWLFISDAETIMTVQGGTIISSLNAAALALRPFTVVRTYLEALLTSDQGAATERQTAAIGAVVVSDQANAIGVTAVPTPVTDASSDLWFLHQWMLSRGINLSDHLPNAIDSKAMRKVQDGDDVLVVAERGANSEGVALLTAGRMLIKLH